MSTVIEVSDLTKRYGARPVVEGLSFHVAAGEIFTLLGPNGAGKTTTVEMLEGLRRPDAGTVRVLGLDPDRQRTALHSRIGVMLQDAGAPRELRVREALALVAALYREPAAVDEMLARVGLADRARSVVRGLSGGELQRLSLAMALVGRPELLFLDEPTAGLDVHARRATWSMIESMAREGTTVFLTTHMLAEAQAISSRVGILRAGRLVALDTPDNLVAGDGGVRFQVRGELDPGWLASRLAREISADGERWRIDGEPSPALLAELGAALAERDLLLLDLSVGRGSLEDVFVALSDERADTPGGADA